MVSFRTLIRKEDGSTKSLSTPTNLVSAIQHVRYLREKYGIYAEVVANTKPRQREFEDILERNGITFHTFPGNGPTTSPKEDSFDGH